MNIALSSFSDPYSYPMPSPLQTPDAGPNDQPRTSAAQRSAPRGPAEARSPGISTLDMDEEPPPPPPPPEEDTEELPTSSESTPTSEVETESGDREQWSASSGGAGAGARRRQPACVAASSDRRQPQPRARSAPRSALRASPPPRVCFTPPPVRPQAAGERRPTGTATPPPPPPPPTETTRSPILWRGAPSPSRSRAASTVLSLPRSGRSTPSRGRASAHKAEAEKCPFAPAITRLAQEIHCRDRQQQQQQQDGCPRLLCAALGRWEERMYYAARRKQAEREQRRSEASPSHDAQRLKELSELSECTFHPQTQARRFRHVPVHQPRSQDAACEDLYRSRLRQKKVPVQRQAKEETFAPQTNSIHRGFYKSCLRPDDRPAGERLYLDATRDRPSRLRDLRSKVLAQERYEASGQPLSARRPRDREPPDGGTPRHVRLYEHGVKKQSSRRAPPDPAPPPAPSVTIPWPPPDAEQVVPCDEVFARLHSNSGYIRRQPTAAHSECTFRPSITQLPPEIAAERAEWLRRREEQERQETERALRRRSRQRRRGRKAQRQLRQWEDFQRLVCGGPAASHSAGAASPPLDMALASPARSTNPYPAASAQPREPGAGRGSSPLPGGRPPLPRTPQPPHARARYAPPEQLTPPPCPPPPRGSGEMESDPENATDEDLSDCT